MNVWTNTYAKKCTYGEYLNKCMDKYVKKYMDELVNECMDEYLCEEMYLW